MRIRAAISPCPNDTWIYGAWIQGLVPLGSLGDDDIRFVWADIAELNELSTRKSCQVVKVSAVQALSLNEGWHVVAGGGAFGLDQGPRIVSARHGLKKIFTLAVPGLSTTAWALARNVLGPEVHPLPMRFDLIPEAVLSGRADAGLLIHETALIHEKLGLELVLDLGAWWREKFCGLPLPLGLCVAHDSLGEKRIADLADIIRASLDLARSSPQEVMPLVRVLAREMEDWILAEHIAAYVNDLSRDMGPVGKQSLDALRSILHENKK